MHINAINLKNIYSNTNFYSDDIISTPYLSNDTNSMGYYSDEFLLNHNKKHILFTGCSVTAGFGLESHEVWSKIVYNKLNKEDQLSGYFNLSIPGTGIISQIANIFKYCKKYGNPETIFFCIPDMKRFYYFDKDISIVKDAFYDYKELGFTKIFIYQYYFMLEQYCKSNNIGLYSFTWDTDINNFENIFKNKFKTFYNIEQKDVVEYLYSKKNKQYLEVSRDGIHPGIGYHLYWAKFIYDKYKKENNDKKN